MFVLLPYIGRVTVYIGLVTVYIGRVTVFIGRVTVRVYIGLVTVYNQLNAWPWIIQNRLTVFLNLNSEGNVGA